eukprot:2359824-Pleurochrysis_carterae.AAC.2
MRAPFFSRTECNCRVAYVVKVCTVVIALHPLRIASPCYLLKLTCAFCALRYTLFPRSFSDFKGVCLQPLCTRDGAMAVRQVTDGCARVVAYHPTEYAMACGFDDGAVRIFDIASTSLLEEYKQHDGRVLALAYAHKVTNASQPSRTRLHLSAQRCAAAGLF